MGIPGFKSRANVVFLSCSVPFCFLLFVNFSFLVYRLVLWIWDLWTDMVKIILSQSRTSGPLLIIIIIIYHDPEWPHRQCVGLAFRRSHERGSLSAISLVICSPARIAVCNTWSSGGTALCRVGVRTSQLDLPSLTPLSVAGCV